MEGHCSTGQSPQWGVVPMEDEEEEEEVHQVCFLYTILIVTNTCIGKVQNY